MIIPLRELLFTISEIYGVWDEAAYRFLADKEAVKALSQEVWEAQYKRDRALKSHIDAIRPIHDEYNKTLKEIVARHKTASSLP